VGAFRGGAGVRGLAMVRGVESSEEEESTLRIGGRDEVEVATTGEKLPGALWIVPAGCDIVGGLNA
jgi:hypothetical protein